MVGQKDNESIMPYDTEKKDVIMYMKYIQKSMTRDSMNTM